MRFRDITSRSIAWLRQSPSDGCNEHGDGLRATLVVLAALTLAMAGPAAQQTPPQPQAPQPPTFRTGVGAVRLDVTVIGKDGLPVTGLTRDDFEVREDGVVQSVQLFQPVTLTGEPVAGSDESLTIRSPEHARQEAEREDVRLMVIFLDDYHLKYDPLDDVRRRNELVKFVRTQMRPRDLFAVMGPLTPISDLGLTRDKESLIRRINTLEGRLGGFLPPRSPIEEAHMRLGAADLARVRAQVSLSALESLVVHLGGLREGRKSILFVSQGPTLRSGGSYDLYNTLQDVVAAANRNNVTIHTFDPRQLGDSRFVGDANDALATDTGGRRIALSNDYTRPLQAVMADASAYYLLGYVSPSLTADGKFRKVTVTLRKGGGLRVIARNGYWAQKPEEARQAAAVSTQPAVPPDIIEALDLLREQARRTVLVDWIGLLPAAGGQSEVSVVLEPLQSGKTAPRIGTVEIETTTTAGAKTPYMLAEDARGTWSTRFEAAPGRLALRATVRNTANDIIDSWSRVVVVPDGEGDGPRIGTPIVYRTASVQQYRALMAGQPVAPSASRRFRRTDRAVVRLPLAADLQAPVDAQLLNRQGVPLKTLPVVSSPTASSVQVELPLGSLAQADYLLGFTVTARGKTTRMVPFTLAP